MSDQILLSTVEAAKYLQMSRRTLEKFRVTGGGPPYHKLGRLVRYLLRDLDKWIARGRRTSTSDPGGQDCEDGEDAGAPLKGKP
jgi:excisionase family DNA binding protein